MRQPARRNTRKVWNRGDRREAQTHSAGRLVSPRTTVSECCGATASGGSSPLTSPRKRARQWLIIHGRRFGNDLAALGAAPFEPEPQQVQPGPWPWPPWFDALGSCAALSLIA